LNSSELLPGDLSANSYQTDEKDPSDG